MWGQGYLPCPPADLGQIRRAGPDCRVGADIFSRPTGSLWKAPEQQGRTGSRTASKKQHSATSALVSIPFLSQIQSHAYISVIVGLSQSACSASVATTQRQMWS